MRKQATLKELCYEYSEDDLDLEPTEWHAADCLVKIFDVYASEFADWIRVCKLKGRSYDFDNIKELLTIYKEEKEL